MSDTGPPVVLVVEDEPDVAETYRRWLRSTYDVRVAADGPTAMAELDASVDVVLLDRMMPEMAGEEVLREIRDREMTCRVAMVTAVDPDFDVVEMGFDAYVTKPPERDELMETIERLLDRAEVDDDLQQYYSLVARRSTLEAEKTEAELNDSPEYANLVDRIERQREEVDEELGDMSTDTDFVGAVREIMNDEGEQTE
ncbi:MULTISPECIES: response regulator [Halolamina]|uniref:Response regulator receiver domain-containing protein n=1 Tax=Halolamina pelagica TaxID=699431 RepID=A0A1I5NUT4_9EURY|nr:MULTISPECIES: response regulator [Halolamina]NHX36486.1 response regulator [Halolamina sp. R1-12]SFP25487.1 Response regulator receiver domain-containing protein [Halolamina pelagica]